MGKIMLEESLKERFISGTPDTVCYECTPSFLSLSSPCRIAFAGRYRFSSGFGMSGNGSDLFDLLYLFGGEVTVRKGADRKTVSRGEAVFLWEREGFTVTQSACPVDVFILRVSGPLPSYYYQLTSAPTFCPIRLKDVERWHTLIENTADHARGQDKTSEILSVHAVSALLVELFLGGRKEAAEEAPVPPPKWYPEALDYIESHYAEDLTVSLLAAERNVSESYFYRVFRENTGETPYRYLTRVRIRHAKTLLKTTELQVKYIAKAVGFHSVNHFIQHFRHIVGVTPSAFRNGEQP